MSDEDRKVCQRIIEQHERIEKRLFEILNELKQMNLKLDELNSKTPEAQGS